MNKEELKKKVHDYWNKESCGAGKTKSKRFSRQYFEEIEEYRYKMEPEIFSFAQFTRFKDQKVLEVGIGTGTDFIQWIRGGAKAWGIDLTEESLKNVRRRLKIYGLHAEEIKIADIEDLPYADNMFDLVYSWGVIHHTPDPFKALDEIIRVTRNGGRIKIMVYNRHSLSTYYRYILYGLLKGKPFKSISNILYHHQESIGTRAFTIKEMKNILSKYPIKNINIKAKVTKYDLLYGFSLPARFVAYILASLLDFNRSGWFMTIECEKQE